MDIASLNSAHVLRYQTAGGFDLESSGEVVGFYSPEAQAVTWLDAGPLPAALYPALTNFDNFPVIDLTPTFGQQILPGLWSEQAIVAEPFALEDWLLANPWYEQPQTVVMGEPLFQAHVHFAQRFFQAHTSKPIGHALLAGKPFLIPRATQEAIKGLVSDDTNYFQTIALAREHSPLNGLFSAVHSLSSFGREIWSKWVHYLHSSCESCRSFAACAICADASVAVGLF
jgi:hypothetical protein